MGSAWQRWGAPGIVSAAALAVSFTGISRPPYWLDEAATVSMIRRDYPDLFVAVGEHLDLVHALYYLVVKVWAELFGLGETALRTPSALATGVAAAGVVALGRRCGGEAAGVLSGVAYVASVPVSRFAQEARPYALVTAAGVMATYAFVRLAEDGGARWTACYALLVVLVGLLNVFALLLVAAHALTLLTGRAGHRLLVRWWLGAAAGVAVLVPFAVAVSGQREQISRIPAPAAADVWNAAVFLAGGARPVWAVAALVLLGLAAGGRGAGPPGLRGLAAPWLFLPPLVLQAVSLGLPVYRPRYIVFCLPAVALLVGAALARLHGRRPIQAAAAVVVLLLLTLPVQADIRRPDERGDDLRTPARVLRAHARPGDAILFVKPQLRWRSAAYADAYAGLDDIVRLTSPVAAGDLLGVDTGPRELADRLKPLDRLWVITDADEPVPEWAQIRLRLVERFGPPDVRGDWRYPGGRLTLLTGRR